MLLLCNHQQSILEKKCLTALIRFVKRLWAAKFDIVAENRKLADSLWLDAGLEDHSHKSLAEDLLKVLH